MLEKGELYFSGKKYISLKQAGEISGYAKDYIGQLCRSGKLSAERVGRDWFVEVDELLSYKDKKTLTIPPQEEPFYQIIPNKASTVPEPQLSIEPDEWEKELFRVDTNKTEEVIEDEYEKEEKSFFSGLERFLFPLTASLIVFLLLVGYLQYSNQISLSLPNISLSSTIDKFFVSNSILANKLEQHVSQSQNVILGAAQSVFNGISSMEINISAVNIAETMAENAQFVVDKITINFFEN